jgi:hypothetical protein
MTTRIALVVYVDLDPTPGPFHSKESAQNNVRGILESQINHYNPVVSLAPTDLQPGHESVVGLASKDGRSGDIDVETITFTNKEEAKTVIRYLATIIASDGFATIAELYKLVGVKPHFTDNYWGWNSHKDIAVVEVSTGYFISLPAPIHLTEK